MQEIANKLHSIKNILINPKSVSTESRVLGFCLVLLQVLCITYKEFQKNNLSVRAGALTYTILLSVVPILAMATAIIKGLGGSDQLRDLANTYIESLGSTGALTTHLHTAVAQIFDYVDRTNFATLGSFGVAGIVLSVLLVFGHIETAMNTIWKADTARSFMRKMSDYLTLLFLVPLSINIAFAGSAFLKNQRLSLWIDTLIPFDFVQALLLKFIPVFFISITLYIIYLFFPNTKVKSVPTAIAATIAGIIWFVFQNIYISFQIGVAKYNAIYGSFATFPLFLIWIYLGWLFILAGAQLAYALQHRTTYVFVKETATASLQLSLAFDILDKVCHDYENEVRLSLKKLHEDLLFYKPNLINDMVTSLIHAGLLIDNNGRILPATLQKNISDKRVVQAVLGDDFAPSQGGKRSQNIFYRAIGDK